MKRRDEDLTLREKLRTRYFFGLCTWFIAFVALAACYFTFVKYAFPFESALVALWFFFFLLIVWLLVDYLGLNLRRWMGWLGWRQGW